MNFHKLELLHPDLDPLKWLLGVVSDVALEVGLRLISGMTS